MARLLSITQIVQGEWRRAGQRDPTDPELATPPPLCQSRGTRGPKGEGRAWWRDGTVTIHHPDGSGRVATHWST